MKKARMGTNPLDRKPPEKKLDPLAWIADSRSEAEKRPGTSSPSLRYHPEGSPTGVHHADSSRLKQAVILSGGGANGAFEVGVLKALVKGLSPATHYQPLPIDIITGTSVGAFNATWMVAHDNPDTTIDNLEHLWLHRIANHPGRSGNGMFRFRPPVPELMRPTFLVQHPVQTLTRFGEDSLFLTRDWLQRSIRFLQSSEPLDHRLLEMINISSFVSTTPLQRLIQDTIQFEDVRRSTTILNIVTTNWETGAVTLFGQEQLSDEIGPLVIMASAALPGFFPPITIDGHLYCDGGVVMKTPILPAIKAGAEVLHMIYMDPDLNAIPLTRFRNTLDTFDRMLTMQFAININKDIEEAASINSGLAAIERAQTIEVMTDERTQSFMKTACQIQQRLTSSTPPYRKLWIHRYHPRDDLSGVLGLLNFDRSRIQAFIERGVREAVEHDCTVSGCIIPE